MPTADRPLAGLSVGVPLDAAARWAGRLLTRLGARPHDTPDVEVPPAPDSTPLADWAASGAMALTGYPDGPPLPAPGRPATAARGALLAVEALTGLAGTPVRLRGHELLGERAALVGLARRAPWSPGGAFRMLRCADGWLGVSLPRPDDAVLVGALLEDATPDDPWAVLGERLPRLPVAAVAARAGLLGLAATRVPDEPPAGAPFCVRPTGPAPSRPAQPLVVDLSALWAGPLCAHLLGLAGARVVKVESTRRPDGTRRGPPEFYDLLNAGHESVALDLTGAAGRQSLLALLRAADVVVESSRPRALDQLGVSRARSGAVWVCITAHGRAGGDATRVGYGDDCAAAGGLVVRDPDTGAPLPCGDALADPLAGTHAAVAALACLRAGGAWAVDVALRDVAAATLTDPPDPGDTVGPAQPPRARTPAGRAADLGAHTDEVLARIR